MKVLAEQIHELRTQLNPIAAHVNAITRRIHAIGRRSNVRLRSRHGGDDADAEQRQTADGDVERLRVHQVRRDGHRGDQDHPAEHRKIEPVHDGVLSNTGASSVEDRHSCLSPKKKGQARVPVLHGNCDAGSRYARMAMKAMMSA